MILTRLPYQLGQTMKSQWILARIELSSMLKRKPTNSTDTSISTFRPIVHSLTASISRWHFIKTKQILQSTVFYTTGKDCLFKDNPCIIEAPLTSSLKTIYSKTIFKKAPFKGVIFIRQETKVLFLKASYILPISRLLRLYKYLEFRTKTLWKFMRKPLRLWQ